MAAVELRRRFNNRCLLTTLAAICMILLFCLTLLGDQSSRQLGANNGVLTHWLRPTPEHAPERLHKETAPRPNSTTRKIPTSSWKIIKPDLYPPPFQLSNLKHFQFVLNNDVCGDDPVDSVLIVTSNTRNPSFREAIRSALTVDTLRKIGMRRVFLLALLPGPTQANHYDLRHAAALAENHEYGDLIMGNFQDTYHNLTYKHLMGLHWATTYCPQAKHIVKMDHDIAVDVFQLSDKLRRAPDKMTAIGAVFAGTGPIRDVNSKWYVPKEEYAPSIYPDYMSGWMYVITPDAARKLVAAARTIRFFWVDDCYVTGVLRNFTLPELKMIDLADIWGQPDSTGTRINPFTMQVSCVYECAVEGAASRTLCDTLVGPVLNNVLVLRLFLKHAEYCYWHGCQRRQVMPKVCGNNVKETDKKQDMPDSKEQLGDVVDRRRRRR